MKPQHPGPFTYPRPNKPPIVLALDAIHRTFNEGMRISDKPGPTNTVDGLLIATRALISEQEITQRLTPEDKADLAAYNRQVTEYNNRVHLYRAQLRAYEEHVERERKQAAIRTARCDKCFTLHGPGQEECW